MWGRDVKTWDEIVDYYRSTREWDCLADLIDHIAKSKYAAVLHPRVGLGHTYCYRSRKYDFRDGVLWISIPFGQHTVRLWYGTEPNPDTGVHRDYAPADAVEGFERLASEYHW